MVFLEDICRCCLNGTEDMTDLFDIVDSDLNVFERNITYSDLIYLCTSIRCDFGVVDSNNHIVELPRFLCRPCVQQLKAAYIFRRKFESIDKLIRNQIAGQISQPSVENDPNIDITQDDATDVSIVQTFCSRFELCTELEAIAVNSM